MADGEADDVGFDRFERTHIAVRFEQSDSGAVGEGGALRGAVERLGVIIVGALAAAVIAITALVVTENSISDKKAEVTQLQQVYDATRGSGASFLGIDVRDNNRQAALDFVNDRAVTFPSIFDPAMRTLIAFGGKYPTTVIPSTLVLDRQHRVAAVFLRELLASDLQPVVQKLTQEAPPGLKSPSQK